MIVAIIPKAQNMLTIDGLLPRRSGWWPLARRTSRNTARVLVVGGCQAASIGLAMAHLNPEVTVAVMSAARAARRYRTVEGLLDERERYDAVFVSADLPALREGGTAADLLGHARITLVPTIAFSAYHPDLVRVGPDAGSAFLGPMGAWHSALGLFAYLSGLSPKAATGLYGRGAFERVGYFDAWDASVDRLRALGAQAGYDLEPSLARWARRGCFMHAPDRMRLHATADLAKGLLDRAGIPHHTCSLEDHLSDDPAGEGCWPVYPEIAAHYGVAGGALFLPPDAHRDARRNPTLSLEAFVEASFAVYARSPKRVLACRRVAAWQADRDLAAALQDIAIRSSGVSRS